MTRVHYIMRPSIQPLHHHAPPPAADDAAVGVHPSFLPQAMVGEGGEQARAEEEPDHKEDGDLHHLVLLGVFCTLVWIIESTL